MRYNKEQRKSIWHWIKGSLLVGAFGFSTAWLIFPLAWLYKSKGADSLLWWWMDDEREINQGWAPDYSSFILRKGGHPNNKKENFWIAYKWHTRNAVWNLKRSKFLVNSTPAEIGNNNIERANVVTDKLFRLNHDDKLRGSHKTRLNQDGLWIQSAGLKFIPKFPWEDKWQVNQGDEISYKTSIIGEGFMWFYAKRKDKLMFRYSQCKIVTYKIFGIRIWKGWRTTSLGYDIKSYVLTVKFQKIKPWK
tara:strand:- start:82263 stop:83006 length:744 start_codon:yes stop_codon:yes gene_type:complete